MTELEKEYESELKVMEFCDTEACEDYFVKMAMSIRTKSRRIVFHYILNNPGSSAREIMEDLDFSKSFVLTTIRSMKNAGLVKAAYKRERGKNYYYIDAENFSTFLERMHFLMISHPSQKEILTYISEK